jgi:cell division protein FtsW (lipid II flippase)
MGIAAASVLILIVFSLFRRVTLRKLRAVSAGLILIAVATPFALSSLNSRFQGQTYFVPDLERLRFESAATKMAGENPMGIGANNYVFVSNSEGYADGAGIGWQAANRSVPVHNAYLLARAEMGFFGQIVFVILIVVPCLHGLRSAFKYRRSLDGDIAIGLAVALIANLAHNFYEFAVHTFYVQSLLFIVIGLLSASKRRMRMHDLLRRARLQRGRHLEGQARAVSDHSGS